MDAYIFNNPASEFSTTKTEVFNGKLTITDAHISC